MSEPLGTVSHYELQRRLGIGGMGEVFLAHDTRLHRQVAIKFLRESASDDGVRRRLLREAQAAAALDHPNICAIYEVGIDADGREFIVMQFVDGETLAARLRRGALGVREALDMVAGIADALDAAHGHGVVHRDLKPQNVMVTPSGAPKLLDFGIAKIRQPIELARGTTTTHLEPEGAAGTPGYMAPEVLQGQRADARSDLFSLGVVLYECLTGSQPFGGGTPQEVWGNVLHVDPPLPSVIVADAHPGVDELCRRLLAKNPRERLQSAAEVRGALQLLRSGTGPQLAPAPMPRRQSRLATAAVVVAILAALTAWWWTSRPGLAEAPPEAAAWYARGIDALRQGAYATGRRALEEAVRIFPDYALAHSRLAEAHAELDEERDAQAALIRVGALVPNQSRLGAEDRLRLDAIRATVLRDFDRAIVAYVDLSRRRPRDAGALVDLGRAQESAGRLVEARQTYERATGLDPQFAAGFLRLAAIAGSMGANNQALRAFDEGERLYTAASNTEGQVETMLRRGAMLDAAGKFDEARALAERSARVAAESGLVAQELRAGFLHGSALVGAGRFADAETTARANVDKALAAGLQGVAADGLIDMAGALLVSGRLEEADQALVRAGSIAEQQSLTRTGMRAATQRAALKLEADQPRDALALLGPPLEYFARTRHQRLEAVALTIGSRAHAALQQRAEARAMAQRVVDFAAASGNRAIQAQSLTTLATLAADDGHLPQAAEYRAAAVTLWRELGDSETLPFGLTNLAELLVRLGRRSEAEPLFAEVDAGIAAKTGAFPTRVRRVTYLRALAALADRRFGDARRFGLAVEREAPGRADETGQLARAATSVAEARLGVRGALPVVGEGVDPKSAAGLQIRAWRAEALLARERADQAAGEAAALMAEAAGTGGSELAWRITASAALAASRRRDGSAHRLASQALGLIDGLGQEWSAAALSLYQARPDVTEALRELRAIGIVSTTRP